MLYVGHLPENDCDRSKGHYVSLSPTNEWVQQAHPLMDCSCVGNNDNTDESAVTKIPTSLIYQNPEGNRIRSALIVNYLLVIFKSDLL